MTVPGALATGAWAHVWAHLQTWRLYTLSYPGLVGLAGAALADGSPPAAHLWAAWAVPTLSWIAGHYLGDYFDRHLDAIGKPQRPIPSGRLSPRAAVASGVLCALAAAVITALAAWTALLLVAAGIAGIVAYSKVFKGRGLSGNAVRGALTALTVVFGAMTAGGEPRWPAVLLAALAFWCHDTASNLVGTLRDVDGDRSGGYHTLPVLRGVRYAARTAALLYAAAIVTAMVCVAFAAPAGRPAFAALLAVAAACGTAAFTPLLRGAAPLTQVRALRAHEVLVAERLILAGAVLAGGWPLPQTLAVLIPLLTLSVLTQATLRAHHEIPPDGWEGQGPPATTDAAPPRPATAEGAGPRPGAADAATPRSGAAEAAGARPGTAEAAAPRPGAAEGAGPRSGVTDAAAPRAGAADGVAPRSGAAEAVAPCSGVTDAAAPRPAAADGVAPRSGAADAAASRAGAVDGVGPRSGVTDAAAPRAGAVDGVAPRSGAAEAVAPCSGVTDAAAPRPAAADGVAPRSGTAEAAAPRSGTAEAAAPRSGTAEAAAPRPGAVEASGPRPGAATRAEQRADPGPRQGPDPLPAPEPGLRPQLDPGQDSGLLPESGPRPDPAPAPGQGAYRRPPRLPDPRHTLRAALRKDRPSPW
ncbi:UbiA family prenyltransferase [Streptomyces sp. NPDC059850]|uniref:UbiA family prenyltransferase n=1 Tax=Streptomyces sp. NPDC059850 TaxID=3346970 RepID=UPI0036489044